MNQYRVEIFTKGHKLAVTYIADAESERYLIDVTLQGIEQHPWVTYYQEDTIIKATISIRVSEIELVKVTAL
jgi:hypothetical protein